MGTIFCVVGKSSAGKDTLVSIISEELNMPVAVSFTTRPKRENEVDGKEYLFITEEEFMQKEAMGEIAECTSYDVADNQTWWYGLTREELEKSKYILVIVNPDGLEQLTDLYGDKVVSFLVECDGLKRLERSIVRDRTSNPRELCRRFLADEKDFENVVCNYIIDTTPEHGIIDKANKAGEKMKEYILEEIMYDKRKGK